jgi:ankyrin repeat protein
MLISHGADINARSDNGVTPVKDAVDLRLSQEVIDLLLDHGADPDIPDNDGKSAKECAPARCQCYFSSMLLSQKKLQTNAGQ